MQTPYLAHGTWEGTVTPTKEGVYGLVSQYWWENIQSLIQEVSRMEGNEKERDGTEWIDQGWIILRVSLFMS